MPLLFTGLNVDLQTPCAVLTTTTLGLAVELLTKYNKLKPWVFKQDPFFRYQIGRSFNYII
jgi:hypothetical protein